VLFPQKPQKLNFGCGNSNKKYGIFPEQLNIKEFATFKLGITVYELYAVICHLGPSSMSGHFVAYCKNSIDNKWYLYNDAIVNLCSRAQQYNDGMPYILFYKAAISGT
jgi:ubiquitin C-terminal hydrolase